MKTLLLPFANPSKIRSANGICSHLNHFLTACAVNAQTCLNNNKTLLFLGDSITDSHRLWLSGTDTLGDGYVKMLSDISTEKHFSITFINKGHDGLTLPHLLRNLSRDCFPYSPDVISILIGINDIFVARNCGAAFSGKTFSDQYGKLLDALRAGTQADILCMSPFLLPYPQEYALWLPDIQQAEAAISAQAAGHGCLFMPLQDFFQKAAQDMGYDAITPDGVHLTPLGHRLLAQRWMEETALFASANNL